MDDPQSFSSWFSRFSRPPGNSESNKVTDRRMLECRVPAHRNGWRTHSLCARISRAAIFLSFCFSSFNQLVKLVALARARLFNFSTKHTRRQVRRRLTRETPPPSAESPIVPVLNGNLVRCKLPDNCSPFRCTLKNTGAKLVLLKASNARVSPARLFSILSVLGKGKESDRGGKGKGKGKGESSVRLVAPSGHGRNARLHGKS